MTRLLKDDFFLIHTTYSRNTIPSASQKTREKVKLCFSFTYLQKQIQVLSFNEAAELTDLPTIFTNVSKSSISNFFAWTEIYRISL